MFYMGQALFKIETVEGSHFGDVRFPMPPTVVHLKPGVVANQVIQFPKLIHFCQKSFIGKPIDFTYLVM